MIVLIEPSPPSVRCRVAENGRLLASEVELPPAAPCSAALPPAAEAFAYFLPHGGEQVKRPVTLLSPETLPQVEQAVMWLPEHNGAILEAARYWLRHAPHAVHVLLCDTAFFVDLPLKVSSYAIPPALHAQGIRRYGGYGLCHEWSWERGRALLGASLCRMVSVYLGNHPNVAALRDGLAVETSIGFTPVEGILSAGGCGDIDPTVVFELLNQGISLEQTNELLSRRAGFSGLAGHRCGFLDLLQGSADVQPAREMLRHAVLKYIGAFIAALGGVDTMVFAARQITESLGFIGELCGYLEPFGLIPGGLQAAGPDAWWLTTEDSRIRVLCIRYDRWAMMAHLAQRQL